MLHTKTIHAELIVNTNYRATFHTKIGITRKLSNSSPSLYHVQNYLTFISVYQKKVQRTTASNRI
jgi:hypothetical protein